MTDQPRISVVTPSYNQAEFIGDTLDSVRNQQYGEVEHLVMDGNSSDGTIEILRDHEVAAEGDDTYDFQWISEPDEGQSDAINKGFERATGEYVAWLNSDDVYFDVDVLSRVSDHFQRTGADIVYGDLAYIDRSATVTEVDIRPEFDPQKLPYRILIGQPATFFRRDVTETERLDTTLDYSMDYEYWLRLARQFEFRHVNDVLAGFRSYEAQKSENQDAMAAELRDILTEYPTEGGGINVVIDNASTETRRLIRAIVTTYRLHRDRPELAFDGNLSPLSAMLRNIGPDAEDIVKAWKRWRTEGASG